MGGGGVAGEHGGEPGGGEAGGAEAGEGQEARLGDGEAKTTDFTAAFPAGSMLRFSASVLADARTIKNFTSRF